MVTALKVKCALVMQKLPHNNLVDNIYMFYRIKHIFTTCKQNSFVYMNRVAFFIVKPQRWITQSSCYFKYMDAMSKRFLSCYLTPTSFHLPIALISRITFCFNDSSWFKSSLLWNICQWYQRHLSSKTFHEKANYAF